MDEQKLKDIQPPKKDGELTEKQKRRNTYIFTVIMSLFNLVFLFFLAIFVYKNLFQFVFQFKTFDNNFYKKILKNKAA